MVLQVARLGSSRNLDNFGSIPFFPELLLPVIIPSTRWRFNVVFRSDFNRKNFDFERIPIASWYNETVIRLYFAVIICFNVVLYIYIKIKVYIFLFFFRFDYKYPSLHCFMYTGTKGTTDDFDLNNLIVSNKFKIVLKYVSLLLRISCKNYTSLQVSRHKQQQCARNQHAD